MEKTTVQIHDAHRRPASRADPFSHDDFVSAVPV
jgi:hypothetical protein